MASSVIFEERMEIPYFPSLAEFRVWALSDDFPERGRIDYIGGRIEVEHVAGKPVLSWFHQDRGSRGVEGCRSLHRRRVFVQRSHAGFLPGCRPLRGAGRRVPVPRDDRFRPCPPGAKRRRRGGQLCGTGRAPDLVVEIVSDSSVAKDTKRLPISYWCAGIAEYWLVDARRERLLFRIHARGADGYEPVPVDGEGCQLSAVFHRRFRLERRRDSRGHCVFDLQSRPCER